MRCTRGGDFTTFKRGSYPTDRRTMWYDTREGRRLLKLQSAAVALREDCHIKATCLPQPILATQASRSGHHSATRHQHRKLEKNISKKSASRGQGVHMPFFAPPCYEPPDKRTRGLAPDPAIFHVLSSDFVCQRLVRTSDGRQRSLVKDNNSPAHHMMHCQPAS